MNKNRSHQSSFIRKQHINPILGVVFVVISIIAGYQLLRGSQAAGTGGLSLVIVDGSTGRPISGVITTLVPVANGQTANCSNMNATSDASGSAKYYNCTAYPPGVYKIQSVDATGHGYYFSNAAGNKVPGSDVTTAEGWTPESARWTVTLLPRDDDGDGIVNNNDTCKSQTGPASNKGCPLATITGGSINPGTPIAYNSATTLSWTSNSSGCDIVGVASFGANASWKTPNLTKGTNYTLSCFPPNRQGGPNTTTTFAVSVKSAPPPPPPGNDTTTTKPPSTAVSTKATQTKTTASSSGSTPNGTAPQNTDTQPPSDPGNLQSETTKASVTLTWGESTDNVGVVGYVVQRSKDQTTWDTLSDSVTDTAYDDVDIDYDTHYFYRVYAKDAAGNTSNASVTDLDTSSFSPNVKAGEDTTITSEDGSITVKIPADASKEDLYCEIASANEAPKLPDKLKVYLGATTLICKNSKGDVITEFDKPLEFTVTLADDAKKASTKLYFLDSDKWSASTTKADEKAGTYSFTTQSIKPFAVLGSASNNIIFYVIGLIILLLLIIGFIIWRRRSGSDDSYSGSPYIPLSGSSPAGPTPPTPTTPGGPPTPSSVTVQTPGGRQIATAPTPAANPINHHSPLDRLNDMESQQSTSAQPAAPSPADVKAPADPSRDPKDLIDTLKAPGEGADTKK